MVELNNRHTGKFLKTKILEILSQYEILLEQIFTVTCDNGANMIAAVKHLQSDAQVMFNPLEDEENCSLPKHYLDLTEAIEKEFYQYITLVRCAVHTMQLSVVDVVKTFDGEIRKCTAVSNNCRKIMYKTVFNNESLPPLYSKTRWGGIFEMLNHFFKQEEFFNELGQQHSELGEIYYINEKVFPYLNISFFFRFNRTMGFYKRICSGV